MSESAVRRKQSAIKRHKVSAVKKRKVRTTDGEVVIEEKREVPPCSSGQKSSDKSLPVEIECNIGEHSDGNESRSNETDSKSKTKKYKCNFEGCSAAFNRPGRLEDHLLAHEEKKRFQCKEEGCGKAYTSHSHLKRHMITAHSATKEKTTFPCTVGGCGKVLKTRDTLIKHTRRAHTEKLYVCQICSLTFVSSERLQAHYQNRHNNQDSHRCERCKLVFVKLSQYNRHMRRHRIHVCPNPECYYSSEDYSELRRHVASEHPKLLECSDCGKNMKDKARMRRHVRTHMPREDRTDLPPLKDPNGPRFPCSLCSTSLTTKGSLKRHVKVMHETPNKVRKPVKKGPERARRKDKGIPRHSIAAKLSSLGVPLSLERALLNKNEHSTRDETSTHVLDLMVQDIQCSEFVAVHFSSSSEDSYSYDFSAKNKVSTPSQENL